MQKDYSLYGVPMRKNLLPNNQNNQNIPNNYNSNYNNNILKIPNQRGGLPMNNYIYPKNNAFSPNFNNKYPQFSGDPQIQPSNNYTTIPKSLLIGQYSDLSLKTFFSDNNGNQSKQKSLFEVQLDTFTQEYLSIFNKLNNYFHSDLQGGVNMNQLNQTKDKLQAFDNKCREGYNDLIGEIMDINTKNNKGNKNYEFSYEYEQYEKEKNAVKEFIKDYKYDLLLKKTILNSEERKKMEKYVDKRLKEEEKNKNYSNNNNNYGLNNINQNININDINPLNNAYSNYNNNNNYGNYYNNNNGNFQKNKSFGYASGANNIYQNVNYMNKNFNNNINMLDPNKQVDNYNTNNFNPNNYNINCVNNLDRKISDDNDFQLFGDDGNNNNGEMIKIQLLFKNLGDLDEEIFLNEGLNAIEIFKKVKNKKRDAKSYSLSDKLIKEENFKENTVGSFIGKYGDVIKIY